MCVRVCAVLTDARLAIQLYVPCNDRRLEGAMERCHRGNDHSQCHVSSIFVSECIQIQIQILTSDSNLLCTRRCGMQGEVPEDVPFGYCQLNGNGKGNYTSIYNSNPKSAGKQDRSKPGAKNATFEPFMYKMHYFTKTGSGQT